ncbi:MAG: PQQ-dependent sugar dehydrogenase [Kofleriaceae bacterium]|nr:PQQ-dependent sugar dehydrogenase [Kofleriaceae bacterium]
MTSTSCKLFVASALSFGLIAGCSDSGSSAIDARTTPAIDATAGTIDARDNNVPDAAPNPACTMVSGTDLELVEVVNGLSSPLLVTAPSGDPRLFIIEQDGLIRVVENGQLLATPFADLTGVVRASGNEQGLLGLAFHPQYSSNGKFYVYYTARSPANDVVIAEYTVSSDANVASTTGRILLTIDEPRSNHNGGMLAFGADGYLHAAVGDGGKQGDPDGNAQNLNIHLGKILRFDVDSQTQPYGIPADNPFASGGGLPEIWAYGLRNPWRFSFDSKNGDIYIGDVGQGRREEISVQPGANAGIDYGWNTVEGLICYNAQSCDMSGKVAPVVDYDHSQGRNSITGGFVYRGTCFPDIDGWYFYADYTSEQIYKFKYAGGVATEQAELFIDPQNQIGGLTSFGQDGFGELYVVSRNGRIFHIAATQ